MKRIITLILIPLILLVGCKKSEEKPEIKSESSIVDTSNIKPLGIQKNVSLKYDLKKNSVLRFKYTNYQKNTQTLVMDTTISGFIEQNVDYIFKVTVNDIEESGNLNVEFLCEGIKAYASSSTGEKITYDSKNPPVDSLEKLKTKNFEMLDNANFSARVSPTGEILDIFKSDKIIEKIIQDAPRKPSTEERLAIKQDIEQGILKTIVQQIFKSLPENEINVDSSWKQVYPTQISVFEMENTATYKVSKFFVANGKKLVQIDGTLAVVPSGKTEYTEGNLTYKFQKPKVTGTSKSFFDLDKNCFRNVTTDVSIELVLNMQQKGDPKVYKRVDKILTKNTLILLD